MLPEATMFWTVIFGLSVIRTPILPICLMTASITAFTWATLLVPVQTRFPEENTRTALFGSFTLSTSPGNCSGLYSVLLCVLANLVSDIGLPREVVATIFCIFRLDFFWADNYFFIGYCIKVHSFPFRTPKGAGCFFD